MSIVEAQFPAVASNDIRRLGEGWDNEVFVVGEHWCFRFPKHRDCVAALEREIGIMRVVGAALGTLVPVFELIGAPTDAFPYPFVGYRRVAGVAADAVAPTDLAGLAAALGPALARLHAVDASSIPPTPGGWEDESWDRLRPQVVRAADKIERFLDPDLVTVTKPYLRGLEPAPVQDGPRRFIHGDVCPDHLIVDPVTGQLVGIIDFADAMLGDPVLDFVGLVPLGGIEFVNRVVTHYELPLGESFPEKLAWLSRVLTLRWLTDAIDEAGDIDKHLLWVRRAFDVAER